MFGTIVVVGLILASTIVFWGAPKFVPSDSADRDFIVNGLKIASAVVGGLMWIIMFFMVVTIVDDGKVGVTRAFGEYGAETLEPGINFVLPWETVQQIDTRVKSYTFSDDTEEAIGNPISAQADGGGNLLIEHTVQLQVDKPTADNLLREVGKDWFDTVVLPPIRSCTRDATTDLTLEEAYTTRRGEIGTNTFACVSAKVNQYGITLVDVLIRDVDPGEAVKASIDAKQQAEQDLQKASIQTRVVEEEARQEAVRAFGVSNAEQIIACGGVESIGEDGETTVITPNESCEDQFSTEYLQWLYINQLSKVDGVVILPPEFDGQLFVQTPPKAGE